MAENQNSREFTTRERCAALISEDNTYDGLAAVTAQRQNYNAIRTLDGASPVVTATITDGALPLVGSARILVDTEGQAPADDLETIPVSGNDEDSGTVALCPDGAIIYLKAKDTARIVTVKNTTNVNGIQTYSGNDVVLSAKAWTSFQLQDGTWRQCVATDSENLLISSQYVKTTGTQTIGGVKTFSSAITASGGVIGNVTGNVTGDVTGSCTGNAASATKLQTARTINGVSFDGTTNITVADNTKVKLDGSNLTPDTTIKTVIETWHEGTEWYRLWSDGWLEQGGSISTGVALKTFKKPFSVKPTFWITNGVSAIESYNTNSSATTTTLTFTAYSVDTRIFYVCGY